MWRVTAQLGDPVLYDLGEGALAFLWLDETEEGTDHHHGLRAVVDGCGASADDCTDRKAPEDDLGSIDRRETRYVSVYICAGE